MTNWQIIRAAIFLVVYYTLAGFTIYVLVIEPAPLWVLRVRAIVQEGYFNSLMIMISHGIGIILILIGFHFLPYLLAAFYDAYLDALNYDGFYDSVFAILPTLTFLGLGMTFLYSIRRVISISWCLLNKLLEVLNG